MEAAGVNWGMDTYRAPRHQSKSLPQFSIGLFIDSLLSFSINNSLMSLIDRLWIISHSQLSFSNSLNRNVSAPSAARHRLHQTLYWWKRPALLTDAYSAEEFSRTFTIVCKSPLDYKTTMSIWLSGISSWISKKLETSDDTRRPMTNMLLHCHSGLNLIVWTFNSCRSLRRFRHMIGFINMHGKWSSTICYFFYNVLNVCMHLQWSNRFYFPIENPKLTKAVNLGISSNYSAYTNDY